MMPRRASVHYQWERQRVPGQDGAGKALFAWRVNWQLRGANGEALAGSMHQGFRDKTDARRSVENAAFLFGADPGRMWDALTEKGPGRKPPEPSHD